MNNLLLYMSFAGSLTFLLGKLFAVIFRLSAGGRYLLLKISMAFYLLPFPLLTLELRNFLRRVSGIETLFQYEPQEIELLDPTKTYFVATDGIVLPFEMYPLYLKLGVISLVLLFLAAFLFQFIRYGKLKKAVDYASLNSPQHDCLLKKEIETLSIQRKVSIKTSDLPCSTFTFGLLRPTIILTKQCSDDTRHFILRHELYHIKSMDFLFRILSLTVVILHFYNPIAYILYFELGKVCELYCDTRVLKHAAPQERKAYGHLLLEQASRQAPPYTLYTSTFSLPQKNFIKERIIMSQKIPRKCGLLTAVALILTIASSSVPVLAYDLPAKFDTLESRETILESASTTTGWIVEDDTPCPEDELWFKEVDAYVIESNGRITEYKEFTPQIKPRACAHSYRACKYKTHKKNKAGVCTVVSYNARKCSNCYDLLLMSRISSVTYNPCPH